MKKLTREEFILKAILVHGNKYDYSKVIYVDSKTPVIIICKASGYEFKQTPERHMLGNGCPHCKGINNSLRCLKNESEVKSNILKLQPHFILDNFIYKGMKKCFFVKCNICTTTFSTCASNIIHSKTGCPTCNKMGKSERKLFNIIKEEFEYLNIIQSGKPNWIKRQHLDIYFPDENIAIEYQGRQHFSLKSYRWFSKNGNYFKINELDTLKYNLCKENNCKLFYFTYEKSHVPDTYLDKVYTDENELIIAICDYINDFKAL